MVSLGHNELKIESSSDKTRCWNKTKVPYLAVNGERHLDVNILCDRLEYANPSDLKINEDSKTIYLE